MKLRPPNAFPLRIALLPDTDLSGFSFLGSNLSPETQLDPNERIGLSSTVENKQIAEELPGFSLFTA